MLNQRSACGLLMGLLLVGMIGCATQGRPVIAERKQPPPFRKVDTYIVSRGDTLYSIAWRFNQDVKTLAARNGLRAPYTIYPGQRLRLRGSVPKRSSTPRSRPKKAKPPAETRAPSARKSSLTFSWPVKGKPSREFGKGNKGLDFSLPRGAVVRAAASGRVVYAGTGLGGYTSIVIVRHGGGYLSAYSLNTAVSVKENDEIKVGARIAEIESTGRAAKLHFEIRRDGEPISPRSVLR